VSSSSLPSLGWHHYPSTPPPPGILLEWGRLSSTCGGIPHWAWRELAYSAEIEAANPQTLYWRWTGIGREQHSWHEHEHEHQLNHPLNHVEYDKMFD
jgi:hypothetical protein